MAATVIKKDIPVEKAIDDDSAVDDNNDDDDDSVVDDNDDDDDDSDEAENDDADAFETRWSNYRQTFAHSSRAHPTESYSASSPKITSVFEALVMNSSVTLSAESIMQYLIFTLSVLVSLLYFFSQQFIMFMLVCIVVILLAIKLYSRMLAKNLINIANKPIDPDKLKSFRRQKFNNI